MGIATEGRLVILDIVFHLSTIGAAQADDPSHFASINKGNVVQDPGFRCERDHARLAILGTDRLPRPTPLPSRARLPGPEKRRALLDSLGVLGWVELEMHPLL